MFLRSCLFNAIITVLLLVPALATAADAARPALLLWTPGEPLDISADSMHFESDVAHIVFENNVRLKQSGLDLRCHKLTLDSDGEGGLEGFVAEGALEIERAGLKIKAMRAEYNHAARRLILSGSPQVGRGADLLRGERISIDFASGAITVEKAQARVNIRQAGKSEKAHD